MIQDRITHGVAGAGVTIPLWYEWLQNTSEVAAVLLPIFGITWIGIQIYSHFRMKK